MFFYRAKSVRDLIEKCTSLSLSSLSGRWYFRGQSNSEWTLLPSLLRTKNATSLPQEFEKQLCSVEKLDGSDEHEVVREHAELTLPLLHQPTSGA
jgi:hypothetical protein